MMTVLYIAAGGALGAVTRHAVNVGAGQWLGTDLPWGTFIVNVVGSFMMGILIALFAHAWQVPQEIRAFLTIGILGGFTTFSSFSLDAVTLYERGEIAMSAAYILSSVILSIAALFAGLFLMRTVTA